MEPGIELLVITPHADDAEFGIAGMVARLTSEGKDVVYVVASNGAKGSEDPDIDVEAFIKTRQHEQLAAARVLGVSEVHFLGFEDGCLEDTYEFRLAVSRQIRRFRPRVVASTDPYRRYTWHRDHRITGQVVADAVYPFARNYPAFPELIAEGFYPYKVGEMLFWGSEDPNYFIDITSTFDTKIKALKCHESQVGIPSMAGIEDWVRKRATDMAGEQSYELAEGFHRVELPF